MNTATLLETYKRSENKDKRKISYVWRSNSSNREISVDIYHHSDRKYFSASACRSTVSVQGNFTVREFAPFSDIMQLGTEPVARFSMSAMDVFASKVLMQFVNSHNEYTVECEAITA